MLNFKDKVETPAKCSEIRYLDDPLVKGSVTVTVSGGVDGWMYVTGDGYPSTFYSYTATGKT
jgi:hypothetical protein